MNKISTRFLKGGNVAGTNLGSENWRTLSYHLSVLAIVRKAMVKTGIFITGNIDINAVYNIVGAINLTKFSFLVPKWKHRGCGWVYHLHSFAIT